MNLSFEQALEKIAKLPFNKIFELGVDELVKKYDNLCYIGKDVPIIMFMSEFNPVLYEHYMRFFKFRQNDYFLYGPAQKSYQKHIDKIRTFGIDDEKINDYYDDEWNKIINHKISDDFGLIIKNDFNDVFATCGTQFIAINIIQCIIHIHKFTNKLIIDDHANIIIYERDVHQFEIFEPFAINKYFDKWKLIEKKKEIMDFCNKNQECYESNLDEFINNFIQPILTQKRMNSILKTFFGIFLRKSKFISTAQLFGKYGPQAIETLFGPSETFLDKEGDSIIFAGFCGYFCLKYLDERIKSPDELPQIIVRNLMGRLVEHLDLAGTSQEIIIRHMIKNYIIELVKIIN